MTVPDTINIARARRLLLKIAGGDKRVLINPPASVHVEGFSGTTVSMQLRAWVKTPDYLATIYALTEEAKLALDKEMLTSTGAKAQIGVTPDPSTPAPDSITMSDPPS